MIIEKIEIESFAAHKDLTLELSDGINLIEGSNESGKSSIASFIKFVLYGVSGKGADGHLSERKRAINFNESHAGGSLVVRVGDKRYRITRNTAVSGTLRESVRTKFSVRDIESGVDISDGREPGEQLLGIPESVFLRSAYLKQGGDSELDGGDIHDAISNILFSGDERLSVERAVERIEAARIPLSHKHGNKGRIYELRDEIAELSDKLRSAVEANGQILTLAASVSEKEKTNSEHIEKYEALKRKKRAYECAKTLESFEQLKEAEARKVSAEMEMLRFKGEAHIPDDAEMDELHSYEISIKTLSASIADTEAQRTKLTEDLQRLNISEELKTSIEAAGGAEPLLSSAERAAASSRRNGIFAAVSALLGGISAGVALSLPALFLPFIISAGAFGACALVFIALALSKKKKAARICKNTGCHSVDELEAALEAYESSKLRAQVLEENLAACGEREAEYKALMAAEQSRLRDFLFDMDIEDEDHSDIAKISETLKARVRRCTELEAEAGRALAYYEGLLSKTEQFDADKLIEELGRLGVEDPFDCDLEKTERNMQFYREQSKLLSDKIQESKIRLAELRASAVSPSDLRERLSECKDELESSEKKLSAYVLAADSLRAAAEELRRSVAPALAKSAGEYMRVLTDGAHTALSLDASFNLSYESHGEGRHIDYMSCGTQGVAYLCLRLALADVISKEGALPVILDEATAHLDNDRAGGLLELLCKRSEDGIQHILFTCHDRERGLLTGGDKDFNYILLG